MLVNNTKYFLKQQYGTEEQVNAAFGDLGDRIATLIFYVKKRFLNRSVYFRRLKIKLF